MAALWGELWASSSSPGPTSHASSSPCPLYHLAMDKLLCLFFLNVVIVFNKQMFIIFNKSLS